MNWESLISKSFNKGCNLFLLDSNLRFPPRNSSVCVLRACSSRSVKREIPETIVIARVRETNIDVR